MAISFLRQARPPPADQTTIERCCPPRGWGGAGHSPPPTRGSLWARSLTTKPSDSPPLAVALRRHQEATRTPLRKLQPPRVVPHALWDPRRLPWLRPGQRELEPCRVAGPPSAPASLLASPAFQGNVRHLGGAFLIGDANVGDSPIQNVPVFDPLPTFESEKYQKFRASMYVGFCQYHLGNSTATHTVGWRCRVFSYRRASAEGSRLDCS